MAGKPYCGEKKCSHQHPSSTTQLIVITGGPGAGKTALLEFLRKILCEHVAILPEAASILYGGGFWRLESTTAKIAAQKAIYHTQNEMQNLVINEKKWAIALCDRGTLDGMAYWPDIKSDYCSELNTSIEKEYAKYLAVIHLACPKEINYNQNNPMRTESATEASRIDLQIGKAWENHPNYKFVDNTNNFLEKVHLATTLINFFLPKDCQINLVN